MPRVRLALLPVLALLAAAAPASAQDFGPAITGPPALGVAADGQAVLAWSGSVTTFASLRPAGGAFGPRLKLSTGGNASRTFALGVGRRGDAVVVWQRTDRRGRPTGSLLASVHRPGGTFHAPIRIPGSIGARNPSAAVSSDGTILVAWRLKGLAGCGYEVRAAIVRPGHPFGPAHRISSACANAALVRTSMSGDGRGAVVWRTGRSRESYAIDAAVIGLTRVGAVRRLSYSPMVGLDIEVAGSDTGTIVVWRDRRGIGPAGATGRVAARNLTASRAGAIVRVSTSDQVVGVARVSVRPNGAGIIAWEEGISPSRVMSATRPTTVAPFSAPTVVDTCGATDASRTYASPARDASGGAAVIFQSACMSGYGLGPDYGIALGRRAPEAPWSAAQAVSGAAYSTWSRIGTADDGELVLAWVESNAAGLRTAILPG
jgi:hypothetical protein